MGKNIGDDLAEGKPTLPLIHALQHSGGAERELLREAVERGGREHIDAVIGIVKAGGALDYTRARAEAESREAQAALTLLPASEFRQALSDLAVFAVARRT